MGIIQVMRYLPEFIKITRDGEYTGDAIILKSTFGKFEPSPSIKPYIESISHEIPDYSDIDFSVFSEGSLGAGYFKFMKEQGLMPFRFSGRYKHLMTKNYLPIFYASVHDFFHVLTGYDASFAGETGVWAFVSAQNVSPQADRAVRMARMLFPIAKPSQRKLIWQAADEGHQMGKQAKQILTLNFRSELGRQLNELREQYGIVPTKLQPIHNGLN